MPATPPPFGGVELQDGLGGRLKGVARAHARSLSQVQPRKLVPLSPQNAH